MILNYEPGLTDRIHLSKMIVELFGLWHLSTEDQLLLLGLSSKSKKIIYGYKKGRPLSTNRDLLDRVRLFLDIHKSLRTLFPKKRDLTYNWMNTRNKAFQYLTPIDTIKLWGFTGLLMVHNYIRNAIS